MAEGGSWDRGGGEWSRRKGESIFSLLSQIYWYLSPNSIQTYFYAYLDHFQEQFLFLRCSQGIYMWHNNAIMYIKLLGDSVRVTLQQGAFMPLSYFNGGQLYRK